MAEGAIHGTIGNTSNEHKRSLDAIPNRQLSLEVRAQRFGFAIFEGQMLIDWGVRSYTAGKTSADAAPKKLQFLLNLYAPSLIATRAPRNFPDGPSETTKKVMKKLRQAAEDQGITFELLSRNHIQRFYDERFLETKHAIASWLAAQFSVLQPILPPRRRPWEAENYQSAVFDAVATKVAFDSSMDNRSMQH
jgi:hypothetical protein